MLKRFRSWIIGALATIGALIGWQIYAASVGLSATAPTTNTDGTPLTDLGGYRWYRRASATTGAYAFLANTATPVYTDNAALEGVNCYVVTAVDTAGNESALSNQACKTVDTIAPRAPTGLTAN